MPNHQSAPPDRLQAFLDEIESEGGHFVLAGVLGSASDWVAFSDEWANMLRHGTLAPDGPYHFKMSEMASLLERMARVPWFVGVVLRHVRPFISMSVHKDDFETAKRRVLVDGAQVRFVAQVTGSNIGQLNVRGGRKRGKAKHCTGLS